MGRALRTVFFLLSAFLLIQTCPSVAWGQQVPVVKEINIRGNRKVESDAIRQRIQTRVGDPFSPEKIRGDVEALFKMGFFDDVKVEAEDLEGGLRLIYVVTEKPSIRSIQIVGAKEIEEKDVRERIDVAPGTVFEPQALGRNADKIRAYYESEGFYTAQVTGRSEKVSDREVDLVFDIEEGAKFYVRDITFEGNKGLSAGTIRGVMATKERFFIGLLRPGVLKRPELDQDVERIKALYLDRGYLQVKVAEPEIRIDKAANRLDIVVRIEEGQRFRTGTVDLKGNTIFTSEELFAELKLPKEEFFGRDVLRKDLLALSGKYSEMGYVFADVVPVTRVRADETVVDVTFDITEGTKAYVERIEIRGNTKTRDKVIRRQVELGEGDVYNGKLLQEARETLGKLGYFESVDIKSTQGSAPEQLVLGIDVKEKPTGRVGIGGGFSTSGGAQGSVFLTEDNLFGLGKRFRLAATIGTVTNQLSFRYEDPFFLDSEYSFSLALFDTQSDFDDYDQERLGGEVVFGRRFLKYNYVSLGYLYEQITISDVSPTAAIQIQNQVGTSDTSSINLGLVRDTRNNPGNPTKGYRVGLNGEWAGGVLGGNNDFYKIILDARYYFPILEEKEIIGSLLGRVGFAEPYGDSSVVPLNERFFLGGANNFRGAEFRKLSPRDPATQEDIGGNQFYLFTGEVGFPIFKDFVDLRGAVWVDVAKNVSKDEVALNFDMEYAFGIGLSVVTPFGPVRIDLGYNPNPEPGNDNFVINFNVGRTF
ncbi:MAG: outer membrane protein assembly factor BamA [candidate division NC10 bacterium]|nr:outer membrane protein assembly factor BamA [candidate division NC10 bacterium]